MMKFLVMGQRLEIVEREVIASGQITFVTLKYGVDHSWKPLHKVIQFTQDDENFYRVLGVDWLSCLLPSELHAGAVRMTMVGYDSESDTNYIQSRSDWQFVDVYTDEGISALNTKRRDGFNRMIADALAGKIDLIITKSVSRFARNTVDSLICADLKKSLTNRGICGILENNEVNRFIF